MAVFNAAQRAAIQARNRNVLVSAAAGSGKTTVMVEKIKETILHDPEASISQFLVITFTRDAARNMKDKLRELLEKTAEQGSEPAARALSEIETATVSTIHAFCTQLLKEYNDNTGAAMNPRVLKESEKQHMLDECFPDAAEVVLGKNSAYSPADRKAVSALLTAFSIEEAGKMVQNLYNVLMGIPDPFGFLAQVVAEPPVDLWNREILRSVDLDVLGLEECLRLEQELLEDPLSLPVCAEVARQDTELVSAFLEAYGQIRGDTAETEAEAKRRLLSDTISTFAKTPTLRGLDEAAKDWKKAFDEARNTMKGSKGILATAVKRIDALLDPKNDRLNAIIRQELRGLELLLRETAAQYEQRKLDAGVIDYADMEQTAYRIMSDPDKRSELLARYRYIYVDECQDVSSIQDAIIKSLTGPGHQFFMVGDIKQSIYGFRHAEPALFEHERRSYSDDDDAEERRIFFMDNYRSCRSVVDAVNAVFTEAMDERITDMDYLPQDHLRCNYKDGEFGPVDVVLVRQGNTDADKLEAQCEAAGRYIQSLIAPSGETGGRKWHYRDIVILLRAAKGTAADIAEHLKKMHIPALYEGVPDFFGLAEVKAFLSLLTVIDNLHNDDALVGTLIGTPFLFTEGELADIRLEKNDRVPFWEAFELCAERNEKPIDRRCREVADRLDAWRKAAEGMSVPDFVWWLMRDTGIYAARGAYPDGKARQANLDTLYQRALDGQKAGHMRLSDLVEDLRTARETRRADSDDLRAPGVTDNFVRIMTMHKSKGLEFPVVILMDLQRGFRRKRSDEKLRVNVSSSGGALGLYLPAVQRRKNSTLDSQGREAFDLQALRKNISETTRLLYVAMTRAQQRLCLIGSCRDNSERLWRNRTRAARIWKEDSMLDMVMPAVLRRVDLPETGGVSEDALWRLSVVSGKAIEDSETAPDAEDPRIAQALTGGAPTDMYVPEPAEHAPLKTSVTTLTRQAPQLSEDDSEETLGDKRKTEEAVRTFRLSSAPAKPAFLEEETQEAAGIGTITHRFIRLIDLDALRGENTDIRKALRAELERMLAEGILDPEDAKVIRLPGVAAFFESDLGRRMLQSPDIRREATFTMRLSPDSPTMVQGIVDCAFEENGAWVLIDYKTDHDTREETFVPRHEAQMNWYRAALERLTGRPVREMWLFALRAGKAYLVQRIDEIQ